MKSKISKPPFLSVIIPLFNEQARLDRLWIIYKYLKRKKFKYEVILVNDGSTDKTLDKIKDLTKEFNFKLITYNDNKGKGYAIKTGMLQAKGRYKLFADIDLSTPVDEMEKFLPILSKYDILIGSRKMKGANLEVRQPFLREFLGQGFTFVSQLTLNLDISDFTCGFKVFSNKASCLIFPKQKLNKWGFDPEILFIARKHNLSIKEIPVTWSNDLKSKVRFPQDIISSLIDLCKIKYYHFRRRYD